MESSESTERQIEEKEPSSNLLKNSGGSFDEKINSQNIKLERTKKIMNNICETFIVNTNKYKPEDTINCIKEFISSDYKTERLLYSELSSYIFKLYSDEKRGIFATNLDRLVEYVTITKEESCSLAEFYKDHDCRKISIKLYDHFHLSVQQLEKVNNVLLSGISETKNDVKEEMMKELKNIEKDYITILGIFAAIVLAFVGGITFSSSVFNNIHQASIFRIVIITDFIAFTLLNVLYLLISFIFKLNDREVKFFKMWVINSVCLGIAVITTVAWFINIHLYKLEDKLF